MLSTSASLSEFRIESPTNLFQGKSTVANQSKVLVGQVEILYGTCSDLGGTVDLNSVFLKSCSFLTKG